MDNRVDRSHLGRTLRGSPGTIDRRTWSTHGGALPGSSWAIPILPCTFQHYQLAAKAVNDTIELWYTPVEWFGDNTLPV
jgi:hypothetical protein